MLKTGSQTNKYIQRHEISAAGFKEQGSGKKLAVQTPFWLCGLCAKNICS